MKSVSTGLLWRGQHCKLLTSSATHSPVYDLPFDSRAQQSDFWQFRQSMKVMGRLQMTNTKTSKETLTRKKTIVKINVDLDINAVKL